MFPDLPEHPDLDLRIMMLDEACLLSPCEAYRDLACELLIYAGGELYDHKKDFGDNLKNISIDIAMKSIAAIRSQCHYELGNQMRYRDS